MMDTIDNPLRIAVDSGGVGDETTLVSVSLTRNLTGGNFSIRGKHGEIAQPQRRTLLNIGGGIGIVETSPGSEQTPSGLVDVVEGRLVSLSAQTQIAVAFIPKNAGEIVNPPPSDVLGMLETTLAGYASAAGVVLLTPSFPIKRYSFRGKRIEAAAQIAGSVGGDAVVYKDVVYVVPKGYTFSTFTVPPDKIVSLNQKKTSQDAITVQSAKIAQLRVQQGLYIYNDVQSRKQGRQVVECGTKSGKFVQIPDGWIVQGAYEEWDPQKDSTGNIIDNSNPAASVTQYWKIFPSPTSPGKLRGITTFTRLIRDLNLNNLKPNQGQPIALPISQFVAYATNSLNRPQPDQNALLFSVDNFSIQGADPFDANGNSVQQDAAEYYGFDVGSYSGTDIISDKDFHIVEGLGLSANGRDASNQYFYILLELQTFPLVYKTLFDQNSLPAGDSGDPNDPTSVRYIQPGIRVVSAPLSLTQAHNDYYALQQQLALGDMLQTTVSFINDGQVVFPKPGDQLIVNGQACGQITSCTKSDAVGGSVYNVTAQLYLGLLDSFRNGPKPSWWLGPWPWSGWGEVF